MSKFAIKLLLKIPPHIVHVATLPCEILVFKIAPTECTADWSKVLTALIRIHQIAAADWLIDWLIDCDIASHVSISEWSS